MVMILLEKLDFVNTVLIVAWQQVAAITKGSDLADLIKQENNA